MILLPAALVLFLCTNVVCGQEYVKRLRSPATVKGFIGGESHDSYVIRARKGQTMTVQLSWRQEHDKDYDRDNEASFWVGELPEFNGDGEVKFGTESNEGKRWRGKIPRTGNYYIYVVAHPTAHYTLRVKLQ
jgi:hypothetical protein